MPDYSLEAALRGPVAGIDEAGRGPLAGPVVAAAVILDPTRIPQGLDDSKKLSASARERLTIAIRASAAVGVGIAEPEEIDRLNILHATLAAMRRAVEALPTPPAAALIDGDKAPKLACPAQPVIGGDARSVSIAAASIIAKTTRDALMDLADARFAGYGFAAHAGYPTRAHALALERLGACPLHRRSFAPVAAALASRRTARAR